MRYSCEDIQRILNSGDEDNVNPRVFERHLGGCPRCADLCDPGREIENTLCMTLPRATPAGFAEHLLKRLKIQEKELRPGIGLEGSIPYGITLALLLIFGIILNEWNDLKKIISGFDIGFLSAEIGRLHNLIKIPEINLPAIDAYISGSPIMLFGLISIVAVVWVFSILEFEKTIK